MPKYYSIEKGYSFYYLICLTIFFAAVLTSNVMALKLISLWGNISPAGVLVFPLSYLLLDVLTEVYGYSKAKITIWLGFTANLFFVLAIMIARSLPYPSIWTKQEAFVEIFDNAPRILAASFLAYFLGSFVNVIIMSKIKTITKGRLLWLRFSGAALIGEGVDSFWFVFLAFGGVLTLREVSTMFLTQWLLKTLYEILLIPAASQAVRYLKKKEKREVFDYCVNFNPFSDSF